MTVLELDLGKPGVIAAELVEVEDRAMAGVAEDDRQKLTVRPGDSQHRHVVVDGPLQGHPPAQVGNVGFLVGAAVDGEIAAARAPGEPRSSSRSMA